MSIEGNFSLDGLNASTNGFVVCRDNLIYERPSPFLDFETYVLQLSKGKKLNFRAIPKGAVAKNLFHLILFRLVFDRVKESFVLSGVDKDSTL